MPAAAAFVVFVVGVVILLVSSGGGDGGRPARNTAAASIAPAPTPVPDPVTPTPAPQTPDDSVAAPAASDDPGDTVLTAADVTNACGNAAGPFPDPDDDTSSVASTEWDGSIDRVLPNGIVIGDCTTDDGSVSGRTVALEARTNTLLWNRETISTSEDVVDSILDGSGLTNLYLLETTHHPAEGLADEYWTRTLTAISVRNGKTAWVKPIEPGSRLDDTSTGSVDEQHGSKPGTTTAIVNIDVWTALDASNGASLWSRSELDPDHDITLTDYGKGVYLDSDDDGNQIVVAIDLATRRIAWRAGIGRAQLDSASAQILGRALWFISDSDYAAFDIMSGARTALGTVPTTFSNALVTPTFTVALVGSELRMFRTGQWRTPLWSQTSDDVTPEVVTSRVVVVRASAGQQLLDASDGSIITSVDFNDADQDSVTGGLLQTGDEVVEVGS